MKTLHLAMICATVSCGGLVAMGIANAPEKQAVAAPVPEPKPKSAPKPKCPKRTLAQLWTSPHNTDALVDVQPLMVVEPRPEGIPEEYDVALVSIDPSVGLLHRPGSLRMGERVTLPVRVVITPTAETKALILGVYLGACL